MSKLASILRIIFGRYRISRSCLNFRSYLDLRSYLDFRNHLDFRSYLDPETLNSSRSCFHRCGKAATLQCPKCVEQGLPKAGSAFCSQDCFKVRCLRSAATALAEASC